MTFSVIQSQTTIFTGKLSSVSRYSATQSIPAAQDISHFISSIAVSGFIWSHPESNVTHFPIRAYVSNFGSIILSKITI